MKFKGFFSSSMRMAFGVVGAIVWLLVCWKVAYAKEFDDGKSPSKYSEVVKNGKEYIRYSYDSMTFDVPKDYQESCGGWWRFCFRWPSMSAELKYKDDYEPVMVYISRDSRLSKRFYPPSVSISNDVISDIGEIVSSERYPGFVERKSRFNADSTFYLFPEDKTITAGLQLPMILTCTNSSKDRAGEPVVWVSTHASPVCRGVYLYDNGFSAEFLFYVESLSHKKRNILKEIKSMLSTYMVVPK